MPEETTITDAEPGLPEVDAAPEPETSLAAFHRDVIRALVSNLTEAEPRLTAGQVAAITLNALAAPHGRYLQPEGEWRLTVALVPVGGAEEAANG